MTVMVLGTSTESTALATNTNNTNTQQQSISTKITIKQLSITSSTSSKSKQHQFTNYHYHHPPALGLPNSSSSSYVNKLVNTSSKAMRYYRLWIYTCNAVLLASVLGFCIVASWIFLFEPKRLLIPGLSLTQPSFLYAYLALSFQSGLLQFIGCLGAQRLNERLLNLYWLLILLLLIGDGLLGLLWIYRFEWIVAELRPFLKNKLNTQYNLDNDFTQLWDDVQRELQCCGVDGPQDFHENKTQEWSSQGGVPEVQVDGDDETLGRQRETILPNSCCLDDGPHVSSPVIAAALRNLRNFHYMLTTTTSTTTASAPPSGDADSSTTSSSISNDSHSQVRGLASCTSVALRCMGDAQFRRIGCEEKLLAWLRHTADILFVLGYCVIAFLKLCFLGILRYEIKEMIQKIKILQGELRAGLEVQENNQSSNSIMKTPSTVINSTSRHLPHNNGRIVQTTADHGPILGGRGMIRGGDDSLQTTPVHHHIGGGGGANAAASHNRHLNTVSMLSNDVDSDTNSHCALIIPEDSITPTLTRADTRDNSCSGTGIKTLPANNGNNNYELQEFLLTKHHHHHHHHHHRTQI